ncbi:MAG TPA: hypothetical protein ENI66_00460 [Candidatus Yonathbacteria bacterium]|nr:hypothetical protein [Candidatus Yonathbacteria bacterium]
MTHYKKELHRCKVCSSISIDPNEKVCVWCVKDLKEHPPKDHCFSCGDFLSPRKSQYIIFGNMCKGCNSKCVQKIKMDKIKKAEEADLLRENDY